MNPQPQPVPDPSPAITPTTTFAELMTMPLALVIRALCPNPPPTEVRRYGPFGNLFFRPMDFPNIGSRVDLHPHHYDHVTWLTRGSINLRAYEIDPRRIDPATERPVRIGPWLERQYSAPAAILVKKNWEHEFTSLSPGTRADCIFALRDYDGTVTDVWNGSLDAYI